MRTAREIKATEDYSGVFTDVDLGAVEQKKIASINFSVNDVTRIAELLMLL
jgi:hypothetical protein